MFVIISILISLIIITFLYAYFYEKNRLIIKEYYLKGIPFDMMLISGIHYRKHTRFLAKLAEKIVGLDIDIILNGGDTFENVEDFELLNVFKGHRSFFVLGNNDHGKKDDPKRIEKIETILEKHNIQLMRNENVKLADNFYLIGIDDPHKFKEDVKTSFENIPYNAIKFVLTHSPEANIEILKYEPDYIFFGHTHGGQVRIPFIGSIFNNIKRGKVPKLGITKKGKTMLIHTSGLGTTLLPLRLFNPPEIIVLRKEI
ncbi:metallophosphoesterase family protein [bacterium]|nr:metallophosphoesterase family protein [bacterium]